MFLFERLYGLSIYVCFLFLAFVLIAKTKIKIKYILIFYTLILAIMAFLFIPHTTADIYRINQTLKDYQKYNFNDFYNNFIKNSSTPISNLYYWAISKTGEFRLLPTINVLICYYCIFYILYRTSIKFKISRKNIACALLFIMSTGSYMSAISGIRTMLAISIIGFVFFREEIEKKYKFTNLILYVIAALIHNYALIIICLRICLIFVNKNIGFINKFILFSMLSISLIVFSIVFDDLIVSVINKAFSYIKGNVYSYIWNYVNAIITAVICINVIFKFKLIKFYKYGGFFTQNLNFSKIAIIVAFLFIFECSIFSRTLIILLPILILPIMLIVMEKNGNNKLSKIIFVLTMFNLLIACARGDLTSLKFFIFN